MDDLPGFNPDWISPPGETIQDVLSERGLSCPELAGRLERTADFVLKLICGTTPISTEIAKGLAAVLGGSSKFWERREAVYRKGLTHREELAWLSELPLADMTRFGWLERRDKPATQIAECLRFFDVPNLDSWRQAYGQILNEASFRTSLSFQSQLEAVAAWLRQGEIQAASIPCGSWNATLFRDTLPEIRRLTRIRKPEIFIPALTALCAGCGVAVAIVRAPRGCRASGATRFLGPTKALMLLSFRYLSDDQLWFTVLHEAAHLLLHGQGRVFIEEGGGGSSHAEQEANDFAATVLIPEPFQADFARLAPNKKSVRAFALAVGISPGIVVGQLQRKGRIDYDALNHLKARYEWNEGEDEA